MARGRKCHLQWEVHGSDGSIIFDQENMNELWVHRVGEAGFVRHLTGPEQPDFAAGFTIERIIHAMAASDGRPIRV